MKIIFLFCSLVLAKDSMKKDLSHPRLPEDMGTRFNLHDFYGLKDIDAIGLMEGQKKIISTGISEKYLPGIMAAADRYGLKIALLGPGWDYNGDESTYIISLEERFIEDAIKAYHKRRYDIIGALLGYPKCCVQHHLMTYSRARDDSIRRCHINSRRFIWPLNNMLDFDGRIWRVKPPEEVRGIRHISLISHNPCSYGCEKSLRIAATNYYHLCAHNGFENVGKEYSVLAKPVFYADDFNFAILDGSTGDGTIEYDCALFTLGLKGMAKTIAAGDMLTLEGKRATFSRNGDIIQSKDFKKNPLILPFDSAAKSTGPCRQDRNSSPAVHHHRFKRESRPEQRT